MNEELENGIDAFLGTVHNWVSILTAFAGTNIASFNRTTACISTVLVVHVKISNSCSCIL